MKQEYSHPVSLCIPQQPPPENQRTHQGLSVQREAPLARDSESTALPPAGKLIRTQSQRKRRRASRQHIENWISLMDSLLSYDPAFCKVIYCVFLVLTNRLCMTSCMRMLTLLQEMSRTRPIRAQERDCIAGTRECFCSHHT